MKEKITENILLWDRLKNSDKPIVLYGMGDGAVKILDYCEANKINIYDIFASDEFVRGHFFRGYRLKKLSEIQENINDFIILIAFATRNKKVLDRIYELDKKYELYAPDMPIFGDAYCPENSDEFSQIYELLADEKSKQVYLDVINFKISGKIKYLRNSETPKLEILKLLNPTENFHTRLHYIDIGAYDGDSILELAEYFENISKITAFEPDRKNFIKLQKNLGKYNLLEKCTLYNIGVWSGKQEIYFNEKSGRHSCVSVSDDMQDNRGKITKIKADSVDNIIAAEIKGGENYKYFIKYDVEGSEYEAVTGSSGIIKKYAPILAVSLYHRSEDLFKLPLLINKLNPSYKIYLRKHEYIPCWDLNLYAVNI